MKINLDFSLYKGTTRLKRWWKEVLAHFKQLQEAHNALEDTVEAESEKLSTEITQRTNADMALSDRINTEKNSRESGYSELRGHIAAEASNRTAGDDRLQNQIDTMRQQDNAHDLYGDDVTNEFKVVLPPEIPVPFFSGGQEFYGERMTIEIPDNVQVYVNNKPLPFTWDCRSQSLDTDKENYVVFVYDTETGDGNIYIRETPVETEYNGKTFIFRLYHYNNFDFEFKVDPNSPTGDRYEFSRCRSEYMSPNADTTGATYTVLQEFLARRTLDDLKTDNKNSFLDAVNEIAEKVNIKKNPDAEDGDIVDTHMTVGIRAMDLVYGVGSFVSGEENAAVASNSGVVGGEYNIANGTNSVIIGGGANEIAKTSPNSVIIGGNSNTTNNNSCVIIGGYNDIALRYNTVFGHRNATPQAAGNAGIIGDAIIVGNGTAESNSNAFRIAYDGNVYCGGEYSSMGADYAEMFEWADGNPDNEDRRGLFAYIENGKMRLASGDDTDRRRIGVISARPAVVGDDFDDSWCGKYLTDIFGAVLTRVVHHDATENIESYDTVEPILNPEYNPDMEYIPRAKRKEYDCWAFLGKLVVRDDGTCQAGGCCYPGTDGIASACDNESRGFYVMERLDETHIKVLIK